MALAEHHTDDSDSDRRLSERLRFECYSPCIRAVFEYFLGNSNICYLILEIIIEIDSYKQKAHSSRDLNCYFNAHFLNACMSLSLATVPLILSTQISKCCKSKAGNDSDTKFLNRASEETQASSSRLRMITGTIKYTQNKEKHAIPHFQEQTPTMFGQNIVL